MSHDDRLFFLARDDVPARKGDCLRIKVDDGIAAVLAFGALEVAHEYVKRLHIRAHVVEQGQLAPDVAGCGALLVFRTVDEIDRAYRDVGSYDFKQHLAQWPCPKGTTYIDVRWLHSLPEEPIRLVSEVDIHGHELRKLEFYADGRVGFASVTATSGDARLGDESIPSLDEINSDPQFVGERMSADTFEALWKLHARNAT